LSFDNDTYYIYSTVWIPIATRNPSIHGEIETLWYYRDGNGNFVLSEINNVLSCISKAVSHQNNRVLCNTLGNWDFSSSYFNAMTGICNIAVTMSNSGEQEIPSNKVDLIYFNNKKIQVLDPIDLTEYNGIFSKSLIYWEYMIGPNLIDLDEAVNVYSCLGTNTQWERCTMNGSIPGLDPLMNTVGLLLYIKVEVSITAAILSNDISVVTKLQ
jgi:hypothetical protein